MFTYSKKCILLVSVFCLGLMGLGCGNGELAKSSSIQSTLREQEIAHIPKESRMVFDIRNGKVLRWLQCVERVRSRSWIQ